MNRKTHLGPTSTGLPANIAAGIACIFPFIGGLVMFLLERRNDFVRFYAIQSMYLAGVYFLAELAVNLSFQVFHHFPLIGGLLKGVMGLVGFTVTLCYFAAWAVGIFKSFSGVHWEIPYIGKAARRQLH
jgi:uncharacterized membrane protein